MALDFIQSRLLLFAVVLDALGTILYFLLKTFLPSKGGPGWVLAGFGIAQGFLEIINLVIRGSLFISSRNKSLTRGRIAAITATVFRLRSLAAAITAGMFEQSGTLRRYLSLFPRPSRLLARCLLRYNNALEHKDRLMEGYIGSKYALVVLETWSKAVQERPTGTLAQIRVLMRV
jgi:hypothetical protein